LGENGGVRCRTGVGCWLGVAGGAPDDRGVAGARGFGGSARGTAGGHEVAAVGPGVRARAGVPACVPADDVTRGAGTVGNSSPQLTAAPTGISPPQTEQRARIDTLVIFAGSSRNTDRHSGQETFIGRADWAAFADPGAAGRA
jgi:hypothetical protein